MTAAPTRRKHGVGSIGWTRRTRGRLGHRDMGRVAALGVELQLRALGARAAARLGLRRERLAGISVAALAAPETAITRTAAERCAALPSYLAAHSHRTWLWGALLAAHDRIPYDAETLFVACLLHDTGLATQNEVTHCFTLTGAEAAAADTDRAGVDPARSEQIVNAITLHMNPYVGRRHGAEAHLLNAGAALDVTGARRWQIPDGLASDVLASHPRMGFTARFDARLRSHAAAAPSCRAAFLYRFGRFGELIRNTPFPE